MRAAAGHLSATSALASSRATFGAVPGDLHPLVAVIGVVTVFQGLVAICVNHTGPILYRPSLLENVSGGEGRKGHSKALVVSYWMSGAFSSRFGCRIAWNIAKNDGRVYSWSVPCSNAESSPPARLAVDVRGTGPSLELYHDGRSCPSRVLLGPRRRATAAPHSCRSSRSTPSSVRSATSAVPPCG